MPASRLFRSAWPPTVLAASILIPHLLLGQIVDQGELTIRQGGKDIGRETFRVRQASSSRAGGDSLIAVASYPGLRPIVEFVAGIEFSGRQPAGFELGRSGPDGASQTYGAIARNRLTVRRVERGSERAGEYPASAAAVLLADSVFAFYLQLVPLATEGGQSLTGLFPASGRRVTLTAQRKVDPQSGGVLIVLSGGVEGEIHLDRDGALQRISLPQQGLEAIRRRP